MKKNLKIVLIIAAVIAVIYYWKNKNAAESEKSDFLGLFTKKGSQKWADKLAKRFCALRTQLQKIMDQLNSVQAGAGSVLGNMGNVTPAANAIMGGGVLPSAGTVVGANVYVIIRQIEEEMQSIVDALAAYGYQVSVSSCKAIPVGGTKQFKPGDQLGKDCLCKSGVWAPYCCNRAKQ